MISPSNSLTTTSKQRFSRSSYIIPQDGGVSGWYDMYKETFLPIVKGYFSYLYDGACRYVNEYESIGRRDHVFQSKVHHKFKEWLSSTRDISVTTINDEIQRIQERYISLVGENTWNKSRKQSGSISLKGFIMTLLNCKTVEMSRYRPTDIDEVVLPSVTVPQFVMRLYVTASERLVKQAHLFPQYDDFVLNAENDCAIDNTIFESMGATLTHYVDVATMTDSSKLTSFSSSTATNPDNRTRDQQKNTLFKQRTITNGRETTFGEDRTALESSLHQKTDQFSSNNSQQQSRRRRKDDSTFHHSNGKEQSTIQGSTRKNVRSAKTETYDGSLTNNRPEPPYKSTILTEDEKRQSSYHRSLRDNYEDSMYGFNAKNTFEGDIYESAYKRPERNKDTITPVVAALESTLKDTHIEEGFFDNKHSGKRHEQRESKQPKSRSRSTHKRESVKEARSSNSSQSEVNTVRKSTRQKTNKDEIQSKSPIRRSSATGNTKVSMFRGSKVNSKSSPRSTIQQEEQQHTRDRMTGEDSVQKFDEPGSVSNITKYIHTPENIVKTLSLTTTNIIENITNNIISQKPVEKVEVVESIEDESTKKVSEVSHKELEDNHHILDSKKTGHDDKHDSENGAYVKELKHLKTPSPDPNPYNPSSKESIVKALAMTGPNTPTGTLVLGKKIYPIPSTFGDKRDTNKTKNVSPYYWGAPLSSSSSSIETPIFVISPNKKLVSQEEKVESRFGKNPFESHVKVNGHHKTLLENPFNKPLTQNLTHSPYKATYIEELE